MKRFDPSLKVYEDSIAAFGRVIDPESIHVREYFDFEDEHPDSLSTVGVSIELLQDSQGISVPEFVLFPVVNNSSSDGFYGLMIGRNVHMAGPVARLRLIAGR